MVKYYGMVVQHTTSLTFQVWIYCGFSLIHVGQNYTYAQPCLLISDAEGLSWLTADGRLFLFHYELIEEATALTETPHGQAICLLDKCFVVIWDKRPQCQTGCLDESTLGFKRRTVCQLSIMEVAQLHCGAAFHKVGGIKEDCLQKLHRHLTSTTRWLKHG